MTPLFLAAAEGHANIVALLLEAGANKDQPQHGMATPLYIAAQNGNLDSVRLLVESRADVNQADDRSETPLMITASEGYLEIVKLLVASGARCDLTRHDGFTAMDYATHVQMSNIEVVRFLAKPTVEHMAEAESKGKEVFGVWGQGFRVSSCKPREIVVVLLELFEAHELLEFYFPFSSFEIGYKAHKITKIRQPESAHTNAWVPHLQMVPTPRPEIPKK